MSRAWSRSAPSTSERWSRPAPGVPWCATSTGPPGSPASTYRSVRPSSICTSRTSMTRTLVSGARVGLAASQRVRLGAARGAEGDVDEQAVLLRLGALRRQLLEPLRRLPLGREDQDVDVRGALAVTRVRAKPDELGARAGERHRGLRGR